MVNPGLISLNVDAISVNEDVKTAIILINRIGGSDGTVSVNYSINNGTAKTEEDFRGISETITFNPGETSKEIIIPILEDTISETEEIFSLSIGNSIGTVLGDIRTAKITILDNDNSEGATVAFSDVKYKISEGQDQATITVNRTGATDQAVSVDYATSDDYAREGLDYVATSGTLTFKPGEASKTLTIPIKNDDLLELKESFNLTLNNPNGIELGAKNTARLFIEDEDKSPFIFKQEVVVSGLGTGETGNPDIPAGPTAFDWTPDGKMLIAKLNGVVQIFDGEKLLEQPFIDLSPQVNSAGQRGLLGLAVHPEFPEEPYVYLAFSYDPPNVEPDLGEDAPRVTRLIRVKADPDTNYTTALPNSEVVLLETPPINNFHAAGDIEFGKDGSLFFSHGDGSPVDGPATLKNAEFLQSLDNPIGKLLRIDPMTGEGYTDNPFYDGDVNSIQSKIYNYGLRNPWRYTFDPETGEPVIGDVGWTNWEEINTGRGQNFGWPLYEGGNGTSLKTEAIAGSSEFEKLYGSVSEVTAPIYAFSHNDGAGSITLGDFYTGTTYPEIYNGALFLTKDFILHEEQNIHALLFDEEGNIDSLSPFAQGTAITQISMGPDSNIYFSSLSDGEISRVVYQGESSEFEPVKIVSIEDEDTETEAVVLEGIIYDASLADNQDISTQLNQSVLDLGTDANFDNLVGFYAIVDTNGGIDIDMDGVADLYPEDQGYAKAAITNRISHWELRAGSEGDPTKNTTAEKFSTVTIEGGKMYAPFVIANAGEIGFEKFVAAEDQEGDEQFNQAAKTIDEQVAYFSFVGANPDGAKHIKAYDNNVFGFEDLPANLGVSDNDFNDAVFEFNFSSL
jgi:glucose/arabinose dehydrogenase